MTQFSQGSHKMKAKGGQIEAGKSTAKEYCENCTPHGFSYWVSSARTVDRLFWVTVVLLCFAGSSYFVKTAIDDWRDNPTQGGDSIEKKLARVSA